MAQRPIRPRLQAPALLVRPELLRADHARVEEAGLVQGVTLLVLVLWLLLGLVRLLGLLGVVAGLLGVVALEGGTSRRGVAGGGGIRISLLVAVRVLLRGVLRLPREARVRVRLLLVAVGRCGSYDGWGGSGCRCAARSLSARAARSAR
ncbi:hypothetical protein SCANM63S_00180 [Streptomyces canarius]